MNRVRILGLVAAFVMPLMVPDMLAAQADGGFQRGGIGRMFDNSLGMLRRDEVREELGLAEEQVEQLESLQRESRDMMREMFQQGRTGGEGVNWDEIRGKIQEKVKGIEERTSKILLPHQIERLEQIVLQNKQRRGASGALESIKEKLDMSDEQLEELKKKAAEAQKVYQEKVAKAREEMQKDVLSVLSSEQRAKYEQLVGDAFNFDQRRRNRGRGSR